MKKTVLNRIGQVMAIFVIAMATTTSAVAQSSVDQEFAKVLKLVEGLKVYNDQLAKQLNAQQNAKGEINTSIVQSKDLGPQVVPILKKMMTALEGFIRADLPFHLPERLGSVNELKALMLNSAANDSDRYRNIMDIYSIESEYGNTYEAYSGTVMINETETPVDMLRIGRIGLYYQTKDQERSGMWNNNTKVWDEVGNDRNIRKAIKVASKTVAPELLSLEIPAPEGQ